jgi:signal transduction histidine kinase
MEKITDKELINELKRRFDENKQSLKQLKELNDKLKIVNKKLEESESLKSHFISNISNEIINPFTSIITLSKSILSVKKEDWKKVISMTALIHSEAFNLDFQLRNIFMAAKIEAGEIHPESVQTDIKGMIQSVIDSFRIEALKKDIKINFDFQKEKDSDNFKTDPEKLRIILTNILSNAVKFSYHKREVDVTCNLNTNEAIIGVQDYGTGISQENQKIIYDRFKRIDSGINSLNRGHGLGLSVSKALIDMLNGSIDIQSEEEKGARFLLIIPELKESSAGSSVSGDDFLFEDFDEF